MSDTDIIVSNETKNDNKPLLCLNMIVKNESAIIKITLEKLVKNAPIDYWVICDTGSTDGTQDIIKNFFKEMNIEGELHEDEWVDFGYNRTKALEYAYNKSKFLLVFDADDSLNNPLIIPDDNCNADGYNIRLIKGFNEFERTLLIRNNKKWAFRGVLHEYIECCEPPYSLKKLNCIIHVSTSGSRNNDPDKYKKDAALLDNAYYKALEKGDKLYIRYAFYCANSYYWSGDNVKAEEWYKKVLELEGWIQEKYISCLELSNIYKNAKKDEQYIYYLIKAYHYDNTRVETIAKLVEYYCTKSECKTAYNFYLFIKDKYEKEYDNPLLFTHKLFSDTLSYFFYLPYYTIICANWTGNHDTSIKMFKIIFKMKPRVFTHFYIRALFYNATLYTDTINNNHKLLNLFNEYIVFLKENNFKIEFDFMDKLSKLNITL
jgi:hypothetical protein